MTFQLKRRKGGRRKDLLSEDFDNPPRFAPSIVNLYKDGFYVLVLD